MEDNLPKVCSVLLVLVLVNLAFLNWQILRKKESPAAGVRLEESRIVDQPEREFSLREELVTTGFCPSSCLSLIKNATASGVGGPITAPAAPTIRFPTKEIYIPLGTGSVKSFEWKDLSGVEAYFDPANYGKIKEVTFEASLRIPTANGRVYARLFNVNDKLSLTESEVSAEGDWGTRVESNPIPLSSDNKLYRVQMKTSMDYSGVLDMARMRIIFE